MGRSGNKREVEEVERGWIESRPSAVGGEIMFDWAFFFHSVWISPFLVPAIEKAAPRFRSHLESYDSNTQAHHVGSYGER